MNRANPVSWRERLRRLVPTRETLASNRWLAWLAPWLGHPKLWHWSRRGVALGVGIGVFFGLLIPLAQIPAAAAAAVVLRAHLPAAAAATLVTNPVTFGPIYYGAYRLGAWMTGENPPPLEMPASGTAEAAAPPLLERVAAHGKPLLVGLLTAAAIAGTATYLLIDLIWRSRVLLRRRAALAKAGAAARGGRQ